MAIVLAVNGSANAEGMTSKLLAECLIGVQAAGADVEVLNLVEHLTGFPPAKYGTKMPPELAHLEEMVMRADGIIFGTPVNWFNMSTLMKAFISFLSPLEFPNFPLEGKVAGIVATCDEDGAQQAATQIASALTHYGFILPPYATVFFNRHVAAASEGKWQMEDCRLLGHNVVRMIKLVGDADWGY